MGVNIKVLSETCFLFFCFLFFHVWESVKTCGKTTGNKEFFLGKKESSTWMHSCCPQKHKQNNMLTWRERRALAEQKQVMWNYLKPAEAAIRQGTEWDLWLKIEKQTVSVLVWKTRDAPLISPWQPCMGFNLCWNYLLANLRCFTVTPCGNVRHYRTSTRNFNLSFNVKRLALSYCQCFGLQLNVEIRFFGTNQTSVLFTGNSLIRLTCFQPQCWCFPLVPGQTNLVGLTETKGWWNMKHWWAFTAQSKSKGQPLCSCSKTNRNGLSSGSVSMY